MSNNQVSYPAFLSTPNDNIFHHYQYYWIIWYSIRLKLKNKSIYVHSAARLLFCCNPCPLHDSCNTFGLTAESTPLLPGIRVDPEELPKTLYCIDPWNSYLFYLIYNSSCVQWHLGRIFYLLGTLLSPHYVKIVPFAYVAKQS